MDPKSFAFHLQHQQNIYLQQDQLRLPIEGPSLANHFVFRSLFENNEKSHHQHQNQNDQEHYRHDPMMMGHLTGHSNSHMGHEEPQNLHKSNPPPLPQEEIYTCPESGCNKTFTHKGSFTIHFNMHRKKNRSTTNSNPSPPPPSHPCRECDKSYRSQCGLYWHEQTIHKKRTFNCTECSKVFRSYCGFYHHKKSHQGSSYDCHHCFKSFSQKGSLKTHLKTHLTDNGTN